MSSPKLHSPPSRQGGRLLVVGPGEKGRGGIASVIRLHSLTPAWKRWGGVHLATYDDRGALPKVWSALRAYLLAPAKILRAEIVHVHLAAEISLLRKLPIIVMTRLLRRPLIVHVHAPTEESLFVRTPRWQVRFALRSATRVVALSQSWADMIQQYVPATPVVVIPNPILTRNPRPHLHETSPVVLFVGKLDARKGYSDLLAAAAIVLKECPSAQFHFAGHGEVAEARTLSQQLGIADSVHLPGWVDGPTLDALYAQANVLALPSYGEGVPMSVIEAMSHGVPVVCTPVGGLPEWIVDGENGLLIQPGDVTALAAALSRLLREPHFATTLGKAGRSTVQSRCTLEIVSDKLEALYAETSPQRF